MAVVCAAIVFPAQPASAHPLGNFTVNRYSRIELFANRIHLRYVLDMAEIPTFQEMSIIDRNRDGRVDDGERANYLQQKVQQLRSNLHLRINGNSIDLTRVAQDLSFPPGQGGLPTLRLVIDFDTSFLGAQGNYQLTYRDDNYADRLGWKEIVLRAGDGVSITRSSVSAADRSAELTAYPDDMLSSPLDQREAQATFELSAVTSSVPATPELAIIPKNILDRSKDELAALIATQELSLSVILFSLIAAFGLGCLHALSPGHGKTVVGAYLVGSRGKALHAVFLGLTVTLTHTIGVFALGLVTLFASQFILPEQLYPWLSLISGLMVVVIGMTLFASRLRYFVEGGSHQHSHADHDHDHEHGHSHLPPNTDGMSISWRSLMALGVSGGLLPCPSALVVLLSAISLHRVAFGLILIVAFSAGLAGVLTAIGLLLVYAGRLFARVPTTGRVVRLLPVGSALVVTVLGVVILAQALVQVGLVRL